MKGNIVSRFTNIWKTGIVVSALLATVVACGDSDSSRLKNNAPPTSSRLKNNALGTATVDARTCATGGTCKVGDTGPGGGTVFYVHASGTFACGATRVQTCTYLEVAPKTWSGVPTKQWAVNGKQSSDVASIANEYLPYNNVLGIGLGYQNSLAIVAQGNDTTTAAGAARAYAGGSKSDWYLPTLAELNLLCQWARGVAQSVTTRCTGGTLNSGTGYVAGTGYVGFFASGYYWSSSEDDANDAWNRDFTNGYQANFSKSYAVYVRPVRAF